MKSNSKEKLIIDKFNFQIYAKKSKPPVINKNDELDKFQDNYLFMLNQNKEKDEIIKGKDKEIEDGKCLLSKLNNENRVYIEKLISEFFVKESHFKKLEMEYKEYLERKSTFEAQKMELLGKINDKEKELKDALDNNKVLEEENKTSKEIISKLIEEKENNIKELLEENSRLNQNVKDSFSKQEKALIDNFSKEQGKLKDTIRGLNIENEELMKNNLVQKLKLENNQSFISNGKIEIDQKNKENEILFKNNKILNSALNTMKDNMVKVYENFNKNFIEMDKKYEERIVKQKKKLQNIKKQISALKDIINNYKCNNEYLILQNTTLTKEKIDIISPFKEESFKFKANIEKLESERTKLIFRIENYERMLKSEESKSRKEKLTQSESTITQLNLKIDMMQKEYTKIYKITIPKYKEDLSLAHENYKNLAFKFEELKTQLEQYKIENTGKNKIIDERNEEILILRKQLNL
jgi:hypothetical protein